MLFLYTVVLEDSCLMINLLEDEKKTLSNLKWGLWAKIPKGLLPRA